MTTVSTRAAYEAQLKGLIQLFYSDPALLGEFHHSEAAALPTPYRELLSHEHHMTVTVERRCGEPVDVRVLEHQHDDRYYWRRILLTRHSNGQVVQFGIVRLDMTALGVPVQQSIRSRRVPLGRTLIEHGVLRQVELLALWRVQMADELVRLMGSGGSRSTFGRTALIHLNGEPAVELLEIVAPLENWGVQGL